MIRFRNVTKLFRRKRALDEVSFEVAPGAIFALVGPNGAGKSTALSVAMNIVRPDGGAAEVLGVVSTKLQPRHFQSIGYVSESQVLPEYMRAAEFLRYCRGFYDKWDDALAGTLVNAFHIPANRRLSRVSRGEKMRVALVSSLAYRPELLVMDEPFSGLDVLVREELIETILGMAEGMTIALASHDLADIESFATHVAYLDNGKLWFAEEMSALAARFREVAILFEDGGQAPAAPPPHWLSYERSASMATFIDSAWDAARTPGEIRSLFARVREIQTRPVSLRTMIVALAKSTRAAGAEVALT